MRGTSVDALLLTIVKAVTILISLVCMKIVSVQFSLDSFGLYSQALLIISTATSISILGLSDAVNFFHNNSSQHHKASPQEYVGTIFGMQTLFGTICAVAIMVGQSWLVEYFDNYALSGVLIWVAFQPLAQNLISMLQILYISVGRSRSLVIVNLLISLARLAIFSVAAFLTQDIVSIIALTLVSDVVQILYFFVDLRKRGISINLRRFQFRLCRPILAYAIPIATFVLVNSLLRDCDKWIIGYLASTEDLAIYTVCSKVLPFDMLMQSFIVILVPIITRYISTNKPKVASIYGSYLNLGFITTSIMVIPAICLSRDLLLCLYDPKYISGLSIFILYLLVDLSRFANISILFNTSGRTKTLLHIVVITLILNCVLSVALYNIIGLTGPALATLMCMWISYSLYIRKSSQILGQSVFQLFSIKKWVPVIFECIILAGIGIYISSKFLTTWNVIPRFIMIYCLVVGTVLLLNKTYILRLAKAINRDSQN